MLSVFNAQRPSSAAAPVRTSGKPRAVVGRSLQQLVRCASFASLNYSTVFQYCTIESGRSIRDFKAPRDAPVLHH